MGLPTVAMGFLTLLMPPAEAATVLVLPSFITNVCWQLAAGPRLGVLLPAAGRSSSPPPSYYPRGAVARRRNASASTLAAPALRSRCRSQASRRCSSTSPARTEWWLRPDRGRRRRIVAAATGVFVMPAVPYLQGLRLAPDDLVQALGVSFTVSGCSQSRWRATDSSSGRTRARRCSRWWPRSPACCSARRCAPACSQKRSACGFSSACCCSRAAPDAAWPDLARISRRRPALGPDRGVGTSSPMGYAPIEQSTRRALRTGRLHALALEDPRPCAGRQEFHQRHGGDLVLRGARDAARRSCSSGISLGSGPTRVHALVRRDLLIWWMPKFGLRPLQSAT